MAEVFSARNLWKRFGNVAAVQGVNLNVHSGEVVGLLGPNGAGKTTTLRMLAGILTPTDGQVLIKGMDMRENALNAKERIGFLSGDTQVYQRLSPREVLLYFGRLYRVDENRLTQRVEQLVRELEMSGFASRLCRTLSSGEKQRANIARAFVHEPDVLILDEPTSSLDVISGQFIVEAIRRERAAGRAIILSTHIMSEAEYLCDRIYLLHKGQIVGSGTLAEILAHSGCNNLTDAFLHYVEHKKQPAASGA